MPSVLQAARIHDQTTNRFHIITPLLDDFKQWLRRKVGALLALQIQFDDRTVEITHSGVQEKELNLFNSMWILARQKQNVLLSE